MGGGFILDSEVGVEFPLSCWFGCDIGRGAPGVEGGKIGAG